MYILRTSKPSDKLAVLVQHSFDRYFVIPLQVTKVKFSLQNINRFLMSALFMPFETSE